MKNLSLSLYPHPWYIGHFRSPSLSHGTQQCSSTYHKHSPHFYWTITHPWNNSKSTRLYSGFKFKFKFSRNPCHGITSWLHQRLIPRRSGPMGRFSVPSSYWKSPLYYHQPGLSCCIYITTRDYSWWRQISANWGVSRPETYTSKQTPIWERDRRCVTIALSIHSMIKICRPHTTFDATAHVTPVCFECFM